MEIFGVNSFAVWLRSRFSHC